MTSTQPPAITLTHANIVYPNTLVFSNINVTIPAGQWTSLLGRSGVGKSSLLHFIAGLIDPKYSSGKITTSDGQPLKKRLAYMSQQDSLLPWLSVLDNMLIGFRLRGDKNSRVARAHELLNKVGLDALSQRKPSELSGGQRQRVALVRTLIEDCPVVLMDEPFISVDAVTRFSLQTLAAELFKDRTVLLVTHDPLEALRLSHHVYVMKGQPVVLKKIVSLDDSIPRELDDERLLKWQSHLIREELNV